MKTIKKLKSLKFGIIILASVLGMAFLPSCEKNEDFPITYSESSDVKTESMVIYKEDWCCKHNYSEVCLPVKGYLKGVTYDFIKVSIRGKVQGSQVEEWLELPLEETTFRLEDFKIYVQKYDLIDQNQYYFLVEMKVRS